MPDITVAPFSGEYSRSLLREQKKYLGILQQQGKLVVDADLNDGSQILAYQNIRVIQSAFPSAAVAEAFKIVQHPNPPQQAENFYIMARGRNGVLAVSSDPESYARMYVRGIQAFISAAQAGDGGVSFSNGALSPDLLAELHHRSTALTDTVLTDSNARFPTLAADGYDLGGMQLVPDVEEGTVFTIVAGNSATTIEVSGGGMLAVAQAAKFYRIVPVIAGADRSDLIWLDVYVGEADAAEDILLSHPINAGYEAARRLVVRQQIRYDQNRTALPFGPVYQDINGNIHYAVALAQVNRLATNSAITEAMIVDLRDPHFGSSFEVAEARNAYSSLKERIDAADAGVSVRYSAQPKDRSLSLGGVTNVVQLSGMAYVGDETNDDPAEFVKLYEKTGRSYLRGNPASLVSSVTNYVGILNTQTFSIKFNEGNPTITFDFASPPDLDTPVTGIVAQSNAAILAAGQVGEGEALAINGRLAIRSFKTDHTSRVELPQGPAALDVLFNGNDLIRYASDPAEGFLPFGLGVTNKRQPQVRAISSNVALTDSVIGNTTIPPGVQAGFFSSPFFEFDMLFSGEVLARFGEPVLFRDERADSYARRAIWDGPSDWDYRVEVEHYSDGVHKAAFLKSSYVDWGPGVNQVNATQVPIAGFGDMLGATTVSSAIETLEGGKLSLGGSDSRRTMQADLLTGGFRVFRGISGPDLNPVSPDELVTKAYVDSLAVGIVVSPAVRAATTVNLAATYAGGPVGATLTATSLVAFGATHADGVTGWTVGQRVLVKNQTNPIENGTYSLTTVGVNGTTAFVLTRGTDFDDETATSGVFVYVSEGSTQTGTTWVVGDIGNPTIGTDPINWQQFSSVGVLQAGDGLTLSGLILAVGTLAENPIKVHANDTYLDLTQMVGATNSGIGIVTEGSFDRIRLTAQGFGIAGGGGALLSVNTDAASATRIFDQTKGLTSSGAGTKLQVKLGTGLSFDGSGNIQVTGATGVLYSPAVSGNWSPVPTLVSGALDTLAAGRVRIAGDTMMGNLVIQKAAPTLSLDATSSNPVIAFKFSGAQKAYIAASFVASTPVVTVAADTVQVSLTDSSGQAICTLTPTATNKAAVLRIRSLGTAFPSVEGRSTSAWLWNVTGSANEASFVNPVNNSVAFRLPNTHPTPALPGYSAQFYDGGATRTIWNSGITRGSPERFYWAPGFSGPINTTALHDANVALNEHDAGDTGIGIINSPFGTSFSVPANSQVILAVNQVEGIGTRGVALAMLRYIADGFAMSTANIKLCFRYRTSSGGPLTYVTIVDGTTDNLAVQKDYFGGSWLDINVVGRIVKLELVLQNVATFGISVLIGETLPVRFGGIV
jgi:hypothetical protein